MRSDPWPYETPLHLDSGYEVQTHTHRVIDFRSREVGTIYQTWDQPTRDYRWSWATYSLVRAPRHGFNSADDALDDMTDALSPA